MSNKNEFSQQFRVLADRFEGEGPDEQLRTVQQAGELLEHAIDCGYLQSDSFPERCPGPNPSMFPGTPGYLLLDPHVRWLHAIADQLNDQAIGSVRREPGGMSRLNTTGSVGATITTWRHRGRTMSDVMRRLANMIGDESPAAEPVIITVAVAAQRYHVNAQTVGEAVRDGNLRDHRPAKHAKNAPHQVDEHEVASIWQRRVAPK